MTYPGQFDFPHTIFYQFLHLLSPGFIEMMSAYVPQFGRIDAGLVCTWVLELEAELNPRDDTDSISNPGEYTLPKIFSLIPILEFHIDFLLFFPQCAEKMVSKYLQLRNEL